MRPGWSAEELSEHGDIQSYIAAGNRAAARMIVAATRRCADRLREHPEPGRISEEPPARLVTVPRSPYRPYHVVHPDRILIPTVWHGARQWPSAG